MSARLLKKSNFGIFAEKQNDKKKPQKTLKEKRQVKREKK